MRGSRDLCVTSLLLADVILTRTDYILLSFVAALSTFTVYRLRHSETKKKHCLIRESCLSGICAKQPINNITEVTWLCTWFTK